MIESMRRTAGPQVKAHSTGIQIHVEQHVKDKMQGWCDAAHSEVSGWFLTKLLDGVFYVYDVFLPEQMGSPGYTKINGYATGRLYGYLKKKYGIEGMADMKGWWHTHYKGTVFWSGTDDDQAQESMNLAEDWSLSIVINQRGDWLGRVDIIKPIPIMVDELPIFFVPNKKKHCKRRYARDIRRWISPFPEEKRAVVWTSDKLVKEIKEETSYVNYAGQSLSRDSFDRLMACPCGDNTCIDCADILSNIKKELEEVVHD